MAEPLTQEEVNEFNKLHAKGWENLSKEEKSEKMRILAKYRLRVNYVGLVNVLHGHDQVMLDALL